MLLALLVATCTFLRFEASNTSQVSSSPPSAVDVWLARTSKRLSPNDADLLRRSEETLLGNLVDGKAWSPYRGIMPSLGTYRGVWNWDSAFHAIALSNWDPILAREQFRILFDKQLSTGALPDVIFEDGRIVTDFTKPPVMAWAVAIVDRRSKDEAFLKDVYPKLVKLGEFFEQNRGGSKDGLFYYAGTDTGDDSGWDNSVRWDQGYRFSKSDDHRLYAVDLNCYMVSHYRAMGYISRRLGLRGAEATWNEKAGRLANEINARLWDDNLGFYVDRDRTSHENGPALTPAGFMPLFVHIAPFARAARMAKLAEDPSKFFPGMPSASYDTQGYDPKNMWRGPAWLNTSYFAMKGLKDYRRQPVADLLRSTLIKWMEGNKNSIYEFYEPKTGLGLGAQGFGWSSAFAISFLLDWDNSNLTWLFQPIATTRH